MLNIAGSFATQQLRKIFNLSGAAMPSSSEDVQLVQALDPERLQPYGQWRRTAFGLSEATVLAQAYSFGVINPVNSNTIVIVDRVLFSVGATLTIDSAVNASLDPVLGAFPPIDETDSAITQTPVKWTRSLIRGSSGQQIGSVICIANGYIELIKNPYPLYPGRELNWGVAPAAPTNIAFTICARWLSPAP